MRREFHVRFWESAGVRSPRATRLGLSTPPQDKPPPVREILRVAEHGEGWGRAGRLGVDHAARPPSAQRGDWSARPTPPRPIGRPGGAPQTRTTFPKSVQDAPFRPPDPFPPGGRARTPERAHKEPPIV